jgi:hypothetical protein
LSDPNAEIDDETGDKIIGWFVTAGLMLGQWPLFVIAEAMGDHRQQALTRTWSDALIFWDLDTGWAIPAIVTLFAPFVLLPGAFGVRRRQLLSKLKPAHRWNLVLGVFVAILLAHGLNAFMTRRDVGLATSAEAVWLHDGQAFSRTAWSQAATVEVSCEMVKRRHRTDLSPNLGYDVEFADGRAAPLSNRVDRDVAGWAKTIAPIDATLRAASIPRRGPRDPACLTAYAEKLEGAPQTAYWSIMGD